MTSENQLRIRQARIALGRVIDPRDTIGHVLIAALGPVSAWEVVSGARGLDPDESRALSRAVDEAAGQVLGTLTTATQRWAARAAVTDAEADRAAAEEVGAWLCIPEDDDWPAALDLLGLQSPVCLWGRGIRRGLRQWPCEAVAVVGSRDVTAYGRSVTFDLAGALAARGRTIISGGAYGVDEAAHRAGLAAGISAVPTIAVMAGGVDRLYPRGNQELLERIAVEGTILSESPPGTMPARYRFLDRNRLIAALSAGTVITESRWRSGAQSTAHHANLLSKPVGAVPGSIHSAASAGCHRLIREGAAVLVTDVDEVLSLLGPLDPMTEPAPAQQLQIFDGLSRQDRMLADALPVTHAASIDALAATSGLPVRSLLGALRRLERDGLAREQDGLWRRPRTR
ncbi:DNA-processing protein DprA [Kocuria palustris]|uniref:DNA-processing protein DprA n=1 Tax=Kocuria palustris TaxID=71999 RepID=UPI0011A9886D|nr:DNA-processing protein DprA [Kocuria palustris]